MPMINIYIKYKNLKNSCQIDNLATVLELRQKMAIENDCEPKDISLVYQGKILKDPQTLESYSIQESSILFMVIHKKASTPTSAPAPAESPSETKSAPTLQRRVSRPMSSLDEPQSKSVPTLPPTSLFDSLGNLSNLNMPINKSDLQEMDRLIQQNPEMIQNMMKNPMMSNMLNDPKQLMNVVNSNPQLKKVFDDNPELGAALQNEDIMDQMNEIMSDPEKLKDLLQQNDRLMMMAENDADLAPQIDRLTNRIQNPMEDALYRMNHPHVDAFKSPPTAATHSASSDEPLPDIWNNNRPDPSNMSSLLNMFQPNGSTESTDSQSAAEPLNEEEIDALVNLMSNSMFAPAATNTEAMRQQMKQMNPGMPDALIDSTINAYANASPETKKAMTKQSIQLMNQLSPAQARQLYQPLASLGLTPQLVNNLFNSMSSMMNQGQANPLSSMMNQGQANPLSSMMNNFMNPPAAPTNPNEPPEVTYRSQLQRLHEMGFYDDEENIRVLRECNGNLNRAIDRLLSFF